MHPSLMRWVTWAATQTCPEGLLNQLWRGRGLKWATLCRRCESGLNGPDWKPQGPASLPGKGDPEVASGSLLRCGGFSGRAHCLLLLSVCAMYIEKRVAVWALPSLVFLRTVIFLPGSSHLFFFPTHRGLTQVWFSFGFCCNCEWLCAVPFYWMFNFEWWRLCFVFVFFNFLTSCAIVSFECLRSLTLKPPLQMSICPSAVPLPQYECIVSKPQTFRAPLTLIRCRCGHTLLPRLQLAAKTHTKRKKTNKHATYWPKGHFPQMFPPA